MKNESAMLWVFYFTFSLGLVEKKNSKFIVIFADCEKRYSSIVALGGTTENDKM